MPTSIYNNSLGYTISKEDDTFTITVNTGINNIAVALYREDSCKDNTYITIKEPEIITESITFKLPIIDGLYKLSIIIDENIYDYFFPYYGNLLKSIINDVELVLCDSEGCKDCGDVSNKDLTSVLLKMISYYILTMKYNNAFLNKSFECLECSCQYELFMNGYAGFGSMYNTKPHFVNYNKEHSKSVFDIKK